MKQNIEPQQSLLGRDKHYSTKENTTSKIVDNISLLIKACEEIEQRKEINRLSDNHGEKEIVVMTPKKLPSTANERAVCGSKTYSHPPFYPPHWTGVFPRMNFFQHGVPYQNGTYMLPNYSPFWPTQRYSPCSTLSSPLKIVKNSSAATTSAIDVDENKLSPNVSIFEKVPAKQNVVAPNVVQKEEVRDSALDGCQKDPLKFCRNKSQNTELKELKELTAYSKRNVYKSIIRHMSRITKERKQWVISLLTNKGYTIGEIDAAFSTIQSWSELEKQKGTAKKSQATVKAVMRKKSPLTFILKEALNFMMEKWEEGKVGKISRANLEVYKEVCKKFYDKTEQIIH